MKGIILGDLIINADQITKIRKREGGATIYIGANNDELRVTDKDGKLWDYFISISESVEGLEIDSLKFTP